MEQGRRATGTLRRDGSTRLLAATLGTAAVFAVGLFRWPAGATWEGLHHLVVYNLPYLPAAAACWLAGSRVRRERTAWRALCLGLLLSVPSNALRTAAAESPELDLLLYAAYAFSVAAYLCLYVTLFGFIRARVTRFHPSTWLDGLIGGLGTTAVGVAFLLGPYLDGTDGIPVPMAQLAWPAADVLLMATLVAVGSILGVHLDRTLLLASVAMALVLVGDLAFFSATVRGGLADGGPQLAWLGGIAVAALAATTARPRPPADRYEGHEAQSRIGWRLLALPLAAQAAGLGVLAAGWGDALPPAAAWAAIACVVAAIARSTVTFREVRAYNEVKLEARTDELTGLANRRALLESAGRVLTTATAQRPAALLLLDLDGFKEVNDSLGHSAGDDLLRQVGGRMRPALRRGELLARLGGDEFAVLLPHADLEKAQDRAQQLRALVLEPFPVEGIRLHVGVSIGVATAPVPAASVVELLRCADVAMYLAKSAREGVRVYVPEPHGGGDRLRTMEELRAALDGDQLVVHLQPQADLTDGRVVGAEALVRWEHPTRGLLSPADVLPAAEQAGLLGRLTDVVLELALSAAARWWPGAPVPVSVNLSAANVSDLDLPPKVAAALARHELPAAALTLELVEDTLMADPERGRVVLGQLRRLGVRTSIDDYGTGYSSLAYLRHLPADELKLDRSLTRDVHADPRAAAIVRHTVGLAHDLGLSLVAEGVEDTATGAALAELGCDVAQGYAVAPPMPVPEFLGWLEHSSRDVGTRRR